ncbi:uncharacterized protein DUF955 [Hoeflea marina]|uniref:Uncharacterized protein DUF955 n=1 Tax=Hoeflea marina TaxID=274592 RepID=A0A317PD40_9HYPH|nr:ImmA/IrrE family metallo-endopeptidase [Hoeflea marina]PWV97555.1 uncharacterized protein DUF955 [Hoeflea marina]
MQAALEFQHFEAKIVAMATKLRSNDDSPLFFLSEYCATNRISIKKGPEIPRLAAKLSRPREGKFRYSISLPMVPIRSYERFCIAHELAHVAIEEAQFPENLKHFNHWKIEELCDRFARNLLISDDYISTCLSKNYPKNTNDWLEFCDLLSRECRVPWMQAGIRITELNNNLAFLRFCWLDDNFERDLYIKSTSLKGRRGTNRTIIESSNLSNALNLLTSRSLVCDNWRGLLIDALGRSFEIERDPVLDDLLGTDLSQIAVRAEFGRYPCIFACSSNKRG